MSRLAPCKNTRCSTGYTTTELDKLGTFVYGVSEQTSVSGDSQRELHLSSVSCQGFIPTSCCGDLLHFFSFYFYQKLRKYKRILCQNLRK